MQESALIQELRKQWSSAFGGTTKITGEGTYLNEKPESVTVIEIFIPKDKATADEVKSYFAGRREELEKKFPEQQSILITFDPGPVEFL